MNAGSQCQYQRPSAPWRRFLASPPRSVGRGRCGLYALDRVGDLVERREAVVHVLGHERADAHAALLLHARRDVDEHERAGDVLVGVLADRGERRDAAERRADERGRRAERARDREDVARERVERVVAVGGPLALAVAAQVDRVRAPAPVGERAERGSPRMAGLAAAVQQHGRRVAGIAGDVGREPVAVPSDELDVIGHIRGTVCLRRSFVPIRCQLVDPAALIGARSGSGCKGSGSAGSTRPRTPNRCLASTR